MKKRLTAIVFSLVLLLSLSMSALAAPASISAEQAKAIALEHAGADASSAVFTEVKLDKNKYEIEFTCDGVEYEYEISSSTGAILDYDWDYIKGNQNQSAQIDTEQAKTIALEHAGVTASSAVFTKVKLDGKKYEIEFTCDEIEYEYEISSSTGAILDYDWDYIKEHRQHHQTPFTTTVPNRQPVLSAQPTAGEILDMVMVRAGADSLTKFSLDSFELKDGVYEIEFKTTAGHYEYKVQASTGEILSEKAPG